VAALRVHPIVELRPASTAAEPTVIAPDPATVSGSCSAVRGTLHA
jgi:hypothetical protein